MNNGFICDGLCSSSVTHYVYTYFIVGLARLTMCIVAMHVILRYITQTQGELWELCF